MKKLRVYISAPITIDKEHYEERFQEYEDRINNYVCSYDGVDVCPYEAVNPLKYKEDCWKDAEGAKDKFSDGCWEQFIMKDIELLATCDELRLFPGWEKSYGCTIEFLAARKMDKHIVLDSNGDEHYDFTLAHLLDHWSDNVMIGATDIATVNSRWDWTLKDTVAKMAEEKKAVTKQKKDELVYFVNKKDLDKETFTWYVVHSNDDYIRCDSVYDTAWILKGSELKSFRTQMNDYVPVKMEFVEEPKLYKKAYKKDKWKIYEPKHKLEAAPDEDLDDEVFDEAYEEDVDDSRVNAKGELFQIGDIVKPTEEAEKRNKEFTQDRRFIVTGQQERLSFDEDQPVWYDLAAKGEKAATYCLPETEMTLISREAWSRR